MTFTAQKLFTFVDHMLTHTHTHSKWSSCILRFALVSVPCLDPEQRNRWDEDFDRGFFFLT